MTVDWKIGVEIETMAPRGRSRRDLAEVVAERVGGRVRRFFLAQSEPSLVPGRPVFENLTLGFAVERPVANGGPKVLVARFVDDLTLQDDCDRSAPPKPGWWRVVGDDPRWLRLCARHGDATLDLPEAISRFAAVVGTRPEAGPGGMWKITDDAGASILIAAPLPGERERPCEIVTAPLERDHAAGLEALLEPARELGFTAPIEGAVHLHFDAAPFRDARALARLLELYDRHRDVLRAQHNKRCRRLGPTEPKVLDAVRDPAFSTLAWEDARERLLALEPSKYVDLNIRNLVYDVGYKHTIEVRVLPTWLHAEPIVAAMGTFEALLRYALSDAPVDGYSPR